MIIIIHGEDILSSRNFLIKQKEKIKGKIVSLNSDVDEAILIQETEAGSLFGATDAIFIENLVSETLDKKRLKDIANILSGNFKVNVFLWEKKELTKSELALFPKARVEIFKLPKTIYSLLDGISPKKGDALIKLFHETLKTSNENLILFMLVKRIRLMLASFDETSIIDDYKYLAPWQQQRIKYQTKKFSEKNLIQIYSELYKIDSSSKIGKLPMTLIQAIDFWLLEI